MLIADRMRPTTTLRRTAFVVAGVAILVVTCGAAYAAVDGSSPAIAACVRHRNGVFYAADKCHPRRDARLTWNRGSLTCSASRPACRRA